MTTPRCPSLHPDDPETRCTKDEGNHPLCVGWSPVADEMASWDNPCYEAPRTTPRGQVAATVAEVASRVTPAATVRSGPQERVQAAREGAERAARSWTEAERALVYATILEVAEYKKHFTADDVWAAVGDQAPMTMGISALLRRAQKNNRIRPTSEFAYSHRSDRKDHDYGRHLRVWESTEVI